MSANPSNPALERLNYFNGQRLAAPDLRAEQGHHVGMRRVLNRSLYSAGIVVGLEVEPAPEDKTDPTWKHKVLVRHGLAFDYQGREIFLPEDVLVLVMGAPSKSPGVVFGNLLTVSYRENRRHPTQDRCAVVTPYKPCSGDMPWGAPTRIVADWVFEFLDSWPADESGKVVLGQVELNSKCEVVRVLPGVRRYAVPVKPQKMRALSLEGEKNIAFGTGNSKLLHFHVEEGFPEYATLYLRGRLFSPVHYTEMGRHSHGIDILSAEAGFVAAHQHNLDLSTLKLQDAGEHRHELWSAVDDGESGSFDIGDDDDPNQHRLTGAGGVLGGRAIAEITAAGSHTHTVDATTVAATAAGGQVPAHKHQVTGTSAQTGIMPMARAGNALTYVRDLQVYLDTVPITAQILTLLEARQPGKWAALGDGTSAHALVAQAEGTGEIDLLKLGVELGLGSHVLEFRVETPNTGGALQYNLYIG